VFKPGTGTITIWENTGGTRGAVLYQKKGIPLTPGPLMVVIKVASSQVTNTTGYWPPALPDSIETIAASYLLQPISNIPLPLILHSFDDDTCLLRSRYVQSAASSTVRLFNLSPVRPRLRPAMQIDTVLGKWGVTMHKCAADRTQRRRE
jgi:hypothetical protein